MKTMYVTVRNCARCEGIHQELKFTELRRPCGEFTYWAPCPDSGEPIMLQVGTTVLEVKPKEICQVCGQPIQPHDDATATRCRWCCEGWKPTPNSDIAAQGPT